jgi:cobalt/nickel transport protein
VIGLLLLVAPHASPLPDGLEKVATSLGFERKVVSSLDVASPLKDYRIPGIQSATTGTIAAGAVGAIAVFAFSFLLARVLIPRQKSSNQSSTLPTQE